MTKTFADYPPLWGDETDRRLDLIELQLRKETGTNEDFALLALVQPATYVERNGIQVPIREVALMAIVSPNPTTPDMMLMTNAAAWLNEFRAAEFERWHYVGKQDPALPIFRTLLRQHITSLENMRAMIPIKRTVPSEYKIPVN